MAVLRQVPLVGLHKAMYQFVDTSLQVLRDTTGQDGLVFDYRRWEAEPDRQGRIAVAYVHASQWRNVQAVARALEMAEWFAPEGEDGGLIVPPAISDALWERLEK